MLPDISNSVPISFCVNVTTPSAAIAIASVSLAEPILPASGITMLPPVVIRPPPVYVLLTSKAPSISTVVAVISNSPLELIARLVPSPSIFSPESPNTIPILLAKCTSEVAAKLILAPEVIVRSVLSPSIFSPVPKVIPTLAGTTMSATAVRLILLPAIVRSVPSPSIFSASSPKVRPTLAGMLMSTPAVKFISPSAAKSNVASALELIDIAESLN